MTSTGGSGRTLASVRPGMVLPLSGLACNESRVRGYADLMDAHHPIHLDEEFARRSRFGRRIAHGPLPLGLSLAALGDVFGPALVALLEIRRWVFAKPVFVGSRLTAEATVLEVGPAGSSGAGTVDLEVRLLDDDGVLVQRGEVRLLVSAGS